MFSLFTTMTVPASMTIETAPAVIWVMLALFALASLGILRAAWKARKRARIDAAELELLGRLARRLSGSGAADRPLAA